LPNRCQLLREIGQCLLENCLTFEGLTMSHMARVVAVMLRALFTAQLKTHKRMSKWALAKVGVLCLISWLNMLSQHL
jgi:hypothetical protein